MSALHCLTELNAGHSSNLQFAELCGKLVHADNTLSF